MSDVNPGSAAPSSGSASSGAGTAAPAAGKNILLVVSGSIAAFKAAALASKLVQDGHRVRVALSDSAQKFVGPATFEGLTREEVFTSTFESGRMMAHIDLMRWPDLVLAYPATAQTLQKFAQGLAHDFVGTLFSAYDFERPFWIAPAMNPSMWAHPNTQEAAKKLHGMGIAVIEPDAGRMACGEVGEGRLIEPEEMLAQIRAFFAATGRKKILVTAGGTREPIDAVRAISNASTGETGVFVAEQLARAGHDVTLVRSQSSRAARGRMREWTFDTYDSLRKILESELSAHAYDEWIHAAAVSDFRVDRVEDATGATLARAGGDDTKIETQDEVRLVLKRNPKLLAELPKLSRNPDLKIISFKLTVGESESTDLSKYAHSDFVVHNDHEGIDRAAGVHRGVIYRRGESGFSRYAEFGDKVELSDGILRIQEEWAEERKGGGPAEGKRP